MNSETYHYKRGANQSFNQTTHVLEPGKFGEEEVCITVMIFQKQQYALAFKKLIFDVNCL